MDDVERLFRHLVSVLAAQAPSRLRGPIQIADLYQNIIPYKSCKAVLRFDTNQDYEAALLRLLSGEHGFATVEPAEAQAALLKEVAAVHPNPGAFRDFAAAKATLSVNAVRSVLDEREAFSPPAPSVPSPQRPPSATAAGSPGRPGEATGGDKPARCPQCFEALPTARPVVFCPFCGQNVKAIECPQCGEDLEPGWKYCVTCGQSMMHG